MQGTVPSVFLALFSAAISTGSAGESPGNAPQSVSVKREGRVTNLALASGSVLRRNEQGVQGVRVLHLPGSIGLAVIWSETDALGGATPWYAISLDGQTLTRAQATSYSIGFDQATFDPLLEPSRFPGSTLAWDGAVFLVQFHTQVLAEYRAALEASGARVYDHLVNNTLIARMTPAVRAEVEALEVVRWVGPFQPELRLEPELLAALRGDGLESKAWYNVTTFERGLEPKRIVAGQIASLGGATRALFPEGFRFEAELSADAVVALLARPEVASIDRWSPVEHDLDIARQFSGADDLEAQTGFTGQGVRGEVMDSGCDTTHPDLQHDGGVLLHGPNGTNLAGTAMTGIVFGDGSSNPQARGILPNGKAVFASFESILNGTTSRYEHTAELLDPALPYQCVLQTNSWGHAFTSSYTSISQQLDDILFLYDIVIAHSQGNSLNGTARPEAWAKNVVAVGGVQHQNTLTPLDDVWGFGSGPASDGRIKPDFTHFCDQVFAPAAGGGHADVAGTSAATPLAAAHFGLFFQMWHNDVWGNHSSGATVFESRPSARLARAAIVNTARQWAFSGANHNLSRVHQGWGAPDVAALYDTRDLTFFVDETDVLDNLGVRTYLLDVAPGQEQFKATLVYRDPKAVNFASVHRINDLSLRVTAPGGAVYWGNFGLLAENWSTAGGDEDHRNVIENVFLQDPAAGTWTVQVLGTDINTDIVPGTPGNNADFALWVTGVTDPCPPPITYCTAKTTSIGSVPAIGFIGTASQTANDLVVTLAHAVPGKNGLVFWGPNAAGTPFQGGFLCVSGMTTRGPLTVLSATGSASFAVAITPPMVGTTRRYQWWFRDPAAAFTTGLSDGLQVSFCP
jgi:hypothetical protein